MCYQKRNDLKCTGTSNLAKLHCYSCLRMVLQSLLLTQCVTGLPTRQTVWQPCGERTYVYEHAFSGLARAYPLLMTPISWNMCCDDYCLSWIWIKNTGNMNKSLLKNRVLRKSVHHLLSLMTCTNRLIIVIDVRRACIVSVWLLSD